MVSTNKFDSSNRSFLAANFRNLPVFIAVAMFFPMAAIKPWNDIAQIGNPFMTKDGSVRSGLIGKMDALVFDETAKVGKELSSFNRAFQ